MKESCRLCLAEDTDQDFAVFSNMLTSSLSVYEAYKIFTLICLAPEDQRNSKICLECLQKLHSTFDFRTQVIENNECLTYKIEIVTLNSVKVENSPISDEESDDFDHRATSPSNSYFEAEDKPEKLKDHIPVYNDSESSWDETTCKETLKRLSVKSAGRAKPCKRHDYFQFGTYLTGHLKLPAGKRRMICKICNFECLALSMRLHHTRQHPNGGIKPPKPKKPQPITNTGEIFVCEVSGCNRDFKLLHRLKKHRLREHPNIEKIPCHLCELFFTSQAQLDKHLIEGHKKKPGRDRGAKQLCTLCGKSIFLGSIKRHYAIHNRKIRYTCDHCPKGYYIKSELRDHILRHLKIFNVSCKFCDKKFTSRTDCNAHTNIKHTNRAPVEYTCPYPECDPNKIYRTKVSLNQHVKFLHLRIRNFACRHCSERFISNHKRRLHYAVHHKDAEPPHKSVY